MKRISLEMKVGIFFVGIFILIAWISFKLGNFSTPSGYIVSVLLKSAAGLNDETPVLMAGLKIGTVKDRKLENGKARVFLTIFKNSRIPKGSSISVQSQGFLGSKYLEIQPADQSNGYMNTGDSFPEPRSAGGIDDMTAKMSEIAEDIKAVTANLKQVFGSEEGGANLRAIFNQMGRISQSLAQTMEANQEQIRAIVTYVQRVTQALSIISTQNQENMARTLAAFPEIAENLRDISKNLNGILGKNEVEINQSIQSLSSATKRFEDTMSSVSEITRKVEAGEGAVGKLVSDRETAEKLTEALDGLNEFVQKARRLRTEIAYRGEYLPNDGGLKSYLSLKVQPKYDKYYLISLIDDPVPHPETKDVHTEVTQNPGSPNQKTTVTEVHQETSRSEEFRFSAQIAKRWHDFVFRGGIIENTGGVGVEYWAFTDHFNLELEMFDIGTNVNPRLKAQTNLLFLDHFFVTTGIDDFLNRYRNPMFFVGGGLYFADDDLTILLTRVPMPNL